MLVLLALGLSAATLMRDGASYNARLVDPPEASRDAPRPPSDSATSPQGLALAAAACVYCIYPSKNYCGHLDSQTAKSQGFDPRTPTRDGTSNIDILNTELSIIILITKLTLSIPILITKSYFYFSILVTVSKESARRRKKCF